MTTDLTMIDDVNGIGRGYCVEPTRDDHGDPRSVLRFILWELDEADERGHRYRSIVDIFELDLPFVLRKTGPRAGLRLSWLRDRWGIDRIAAEPVQAAIRAHLTRVEEAA